MGYVGTLMRPGGVLVLLRLSGQKRKLGKEMVKFWMLYQALTTIEPGHGKEKVRWGPMP